eukprot:TRINITY_DN20047_c0_g1_i7.p1 TRINITY_DN20047_c0_g1~~TRINITY_DN20047_c0_g1_i7.p1  ORF type:complete len:228 (+),score=38.35 TRINITY_DN20047_c0_g1_i7:136-819(+)
MDSRLLSPLTPTYLTATTIQRELLRVDQHDWISAPLVDNTLTADVVQPTTKVTLIEPVTESRVIFSWQTSCHDSVSSIQFMARLPTVEVDAQSRYGLGCHILWGSDQTTDQILQTAKQLIGMFRLVDSAKASLSPGRYNIAIDIQVVPTPVTHGQLQLICTPKLDVELPGLLLVMGLDENHPVRWSLDLEGAATSVELALARHMGARAGTSVHAVLESWLHAIQTEL